MTNAESPKGGASGSGAVNYRTACLRLPQFPLQVLLRKRKAWRGERVVVLAEEKSDSRVLYCNPKAFAAGVKRGQRYAASLSFAPDLKVGVVPEEELSRAEDDFLTVLRGFSPSIRRRSSELSSGLYVLDIQGLSQAFKGMKNWALGLMRAARAKGWDPHLVVGFTAFATEMASYHLNRESPIRIFQNLAQEERKTLGAPLHFFSLPAEDLERLARFQIFTLEDFLGLESDELKERFGEQVLDFYERASGAIFANFPPLPELEPLCKSFGFSHPVSEMGAILQASERLLDELLSEVVKREEAVSTLTLSLSLEGDEHREECIRPTQASANRVWLVSLLKLRLERHFRESPLSWGSRVESLILHLETEPDCETQEELFTDWTFSLENSAESLFIRDKRSALWALSQVRAQMGEACLVRARLVDHHLPSEDHAWVQSKESMACLSSQKRGDDVAFNQRVRRFIAQRVGLSSQRVWDRVFGPYNFSGNWWNKGHDRDYFFAQKAEQTAWFYKDRAHGRFRVQGWLQ